MNPTIPNAEGSAFEAPNNNLESSVSRQESAGNLNPGKSPNTLQDVESRESKTGPSGGGQAQDDNSDDDARKQVEATLQDNAAQGQQSYSATSVVSQQDDDTEDKADSVFVDKVKKVISSTADDPESRVNGIAKIQAEFILSRFNHQVKVAKEG